MKDDLNSSAAPADSGATLTESLQAASDPYLNEELALAMLERRELPGDVIERLGKNPALANCRKVQLAVVKHPRTPRHVALPIVRQLFTFDLMQVALSPSIQPDIKVLAEDHLIRRLEILTIGERLSLARRATGSVAGALLLDAEHRVMEAALDNPRLTEVLLIKQFKQCSTPLVEMVSRHPKWSARVDVRLALLRSEKIPLARALDIIPSLSPEQVRDVLNGSRISRDIRNYLVESLSTKP